jgi:hypothetical protein
MGKYARGQEVQKRTTCIQVTNIEQNNVSGNLLNYPRITGCMDFAHQWEF